MSVPELSPKEKDQALAKARRMRSERARLRRDLKRGALTLEDVLADSNNEVIQKMRVAYLLQSLPSVGKVMCEKAMHDIGIHVNRRVQGLGSRQRMKLLKRFGFRA